MRKMPLKEYNIFEKTRLSRRPPSVMGRGTGSLSVSEQTVPHLNFESLRLVLKCCPFDRALELEESERLAHENIKDIIAVGFNPETTFIFTDFQYVGGAFYRNMVRIQR